MNWFLARLREPSTKRGLVWIAGGSWILIQAMRGHSVNPDALFHQIDLWLGIIMTVSGALGLLPDEPKTVKIELPPIELQSRSEPAAAPADPQPVRPTDGVRVSMPPQNSPRSYPSADPNTYPRFGSGFGDRN